MSEPELYPGRHPAAALVAVLCELHAIGKERGQIVSVGLRIPTWDEPLLGVLEMVSIDGPFPVKVVVTIPWTEAKERALDLPEPPGSWTAQFCWERVPAPEWDFTDIPALAMLLREGMNGILGVTGLTIEIPMVFDDASWGLGAVELRHEWSIDLADLHDAEARATALESIVVHAIDGLRWLRADHQLPAVRLAVAA